MRPENYSYFTFTFSLKPPTNPIVQVFGVAGVRISLARVKYAQLYNYYCIFPFTVAPICTKNQQTEYVVASGRSVTVSCDVEAFPSSVTFTWAIKKSTGPPVRLQTVGRDEGLTGHYTLNRVEEESVELWCFARNSIGNQVSPCKYTVYTQ
ncbi:hypothetical protein SK128_010568, partial [Halocaridina rubra]